MQRTRVIQFGNAGGRAALHDFGYGGGESGASGGDGGGDDNARPLLLLLHANGFPCCCYKPLARACVCFIAAG